MSSFSKHNIGHLSASSINLFISEPALWCAQYLLGKRTPIGVAAVRGIAIEAGIEAGLFDPDMPIEAAQQIALDTFNTKTALNPDPKVQTEREAIAPAVKLGLDELRRYGVPDRAEDGRQHKVELELPGVPVPLWGFLDFMWSTHGTIVDLKTTLRMPSEISGTHAMQGAVYKQAKGNYEMRFAYVTPKKIAVYVLEDHERHLKRLTQAAKAIGNLLALSDDAEKLTACFAPDLSSFYWAGPAARSIANDVWQTGE